MRRNFLSGGEVILYYMALRLLGGRWNILSAVTTKLADWGKKEWSRLYNHFHYIVKTKMSHVNIIARIALNFPHFCVQVCSHLFGICTITQHTNVAICWFHSQTIPNAFISHKARRFSVTYIIMLLCAVFVKHWTQLCLICLRLYYKIKDVCKEN